MATITAKYNGRCSNCNGKIVAGTRINYNGQASHLNCVAEGPKLKPGWYVIQFQDDAILGYRNGTKAQRIFSGPWTEEKAWEEQKRMKFMNKFAAGIDSIYYGVREIKAETPTANVESTKEYTFSEADAGERMEPEE